MLAHCELVHSSQYRRGQAHDVSALHTEDMKTLWSCLRQVQRAGSGMCVAHPPQQATIVLEKFVVDGALAGAAEVPHQLQLAGVPLVRVTLHNRDLAPGTASLEHVQATEAHTRMRGCTCKLLGCCCDCRVTIGEEGVGVADRVTTWFASKIAL